MYIYIYIYICLFPPPVLRASVTLTGMCIARECSGHHRKGTPGIGNVDYVFDIGH